MKKLMICAALSSTILFTSCLGSFSAFNSLRDWNDGLTSNKFLDNLIFWALNIVPVYGLFFIGDVIIFNVIEFWSGSNPIAMNEGDIETQIVERDGNTYKMIATKNHLQINVIDGIDKGQSLKMIYNPEEKSWSAIKADGEVIKLSSFEDGFYIVYTPDGQEIKIDPTATKQEGLALLNQGVANYRDCMLAMN
ncbi:MAG: DUF3332 domain-containing protein [Flavobacteriaceae bacterium]|nr:DUF3332 domain-containing protein [Flavobacteriaceae bacterium]